MTAYRKICALAVALCALSSLPTAAQPDVPAWPSVQVAERPKSKSTSNPKSIGPLTLGMGQGEVQAKLGPPSSSSRRSMMNMTDEYTYMWEYSALGVTLYFSAPDETSPGSILAIKAAPPCDWTAVGGLQVGLNIDDTAEILQSQGGRSTTPIGSVGTDTAGLYYERIDTAVIMRLELGKIAVIYVGPNLP